MGSAETGRVARGGAASCGTDHVSTTVATADVFFLPFLALVLVLPMVESENKVESEALGYTDAEGTKPEKSDTNSGNLEMLPEVDEKGRFKVQRL